MAPAAAAMVREVPGPVAADQVFDIPVDLIEMGERLRPIDMVWAEALGAIMEREGQHQPVEVYRLPGRQTFALAHGGHRLAAARNRGWATIRGFIKSGSAAQRLRSEISENLWRKGLSPLDRAAFVAALHEQLRVEAGIAPDTSLHQLAANKRWKAEADDASRTMRQAFGWAADVALQLGVDRATIYRDLALFRGLLPGVAAQLAETPTGRNAAQLRTLAKLPDDQQRAAAALILSGEARSAGEAIAALQNRVKPTDEGKRLSAFLGSYQRMGRAERKAALATLRGLLTAEDLAALTGGSADA